MGLIFIEIIVANNAGFCGGVKRAVDLAFKNADNGVYSYGELVLISCDKELSDKGVVNINDTNVKNSKVIIRSHGVKKKVLDELKNNGNKIIDCVCPKVANIYSIVREHYELGYQIVIFGDETHPGNS